MKLCHNIAVLRFLYNLKQTQVAQFIGVAPQTYNGYERGTHTPPLDKLVALADLYGVSVDTLIGRSLYADGQ